MTISNLALKIKEFDGLPGRVIRKSDTLFRGGGRGRGRGEGGRGRGERQRVRESRSIPPVAEPCSTSVFASDDPTTDDN